MNTQPNYIKVTNAEFINTIFGGIKSDEYIWINTFAQSPTNGSWAGKAAYPNQIVDTPFANSYFCVSFLKKDEQQKRRQRNSFSRLMCVVIDDPDIFDVIPSWKLETSHNNYQMGFILAEPITDLGVASRLHAALANQKLINADTSGNNPVRYVRMPVGLNTKYDPPFPHNMVEWMPELRFSLQEICDMLEIDCDSIINGIAMAKPPATIGGILEGNRNAGLTALAGSMRHNGLSEDAIYSALVTTNAERCEPPLDESEVQSIARSVASYDPEHDLAANAAIGHDAAEALLMKAVIPSYTYDPEKLSATEYVLDGFLGMGLTVLAGEPGGGKTSLVTQLIAHAAWLCRKDSKLKPELRRHVIYISEDTEQVERIIYGMNRYGGLGIPKQEFTDWFHIREACRSNPYEIARMIKDLKKEFSYTLDNGFVVCPVIVLDTSNATIDIENENDNSEVGKVIALLKQSSDGTAIVVIAHTPKALNRTDLASLSPRGASAWVGDARATIYLFRDDALPESRFLALGKRRFEPKYTELQFTSEVRSEVVKTAWGTTQEVGLRIVSIKESSESKRKEAGKIGAQAAHDLAKFKQKDKVIEAINSLPELEYFTGNELIEIAQIRKNDATALFESMAQEGLISKVTLNLTPRIVKRNRQHVIAYMRQEKYQKESNGE